MSSNVSFDKGGFDKIAKRAVQAKAKEIQSLLDRLLRTHSGKPIDEIKRVLVREWPRDGGKMTDAEATDWATHISQGRRIVVKT
jgi:hypothetical protein